jgi:hypothetical protein
MVNAAPKTPTAPAQSHGRIRVEILPLRKLASG